MSEPTTPDIATSEDELDKRIMEQTPPLAWTFRPAGEVKVPTVVRGLTESIKATATHLIEGEVGMAPADDLKANEERPILGRYLNSIGYRLKVREGLFATDGGKTALYFVIQAIARNN